MPFTVTSLLASNAFVTFVITQIYGQSIDELLAWGHAPVIIINDTSDNNDTVSINNVPSSSTNISVSNITVSSTGTIIVADVDEISIVSDIDTRSENDTSSSNTSTKPQPRPRPTSKSSSSSSSSTGDHRLPPPRPVIRDTSSSTATFQPSIACFTSQPLSSLSNLLLVITVISAAHDRSS
jgi:hypothetical protein